MAGSRGGERRVYDLAYPLRVIVGVAFALIVVLTILQVFCRFVLDSPLIWSEELAQLLLVWVTFVGAAVVCWDGRHLNVSVLFDRLPARWRKPVSIFNAVVAIAVLVVLVVGALPLIRINMNVDMSALGISASWLRAPAIVGGILMIAFIVLRRFYRLPRQGTDGADGKHEPM